MKNLIITEIRDGYTKPVIKAEDYIFGSSSVPDVILEPTGRWTDFLPEDETQKKQFDSFGCTIFTTNNQVEIFSKRIFGGKPNFSDRAGYIMANIAPPGADPQTIYEMIRKSGIVDEKDLAWTDDINTLEKYSQPKPLPKNLLDKAKQWLNEVFFKHQYLPTINGQITQETMKSALQRSPLAIAVDAWNLDTTTGKYVRIGEDTHWTLIIEFKEGDYFLCYDTYSPFLKKLDWNFGFTVAKKIYLRKKTEEEKKIETNLEQQISLMQKVVELLKKLIYFLTS